jgi:hypothetical protein
VYLCFPYANILHQEFLKKEIGMNEDLLNSLYRPDNSMLTAKSNGQEQPNLLHLMAIDAYVYGYPLVLINVTKKAMLANGSHLNQFLNERTFPTPQFTTIIRPNVDTLYSMAWLDLSIEPIILYVPETDHQYYLMELLDAWTNVFASIGTRTTGSREGAYAITGPKWNGLLPEGVIRVEAPNNTVWIIGRTQTNGLKDYPKVYTIQNQYDLITLSCWGKPAAQYTGDEGQKQMPINSADLVAKMDAATFFQTMMMAMNENPTWIADPEINCKLTALGLVPDKTFDFYSLRPSIKQALQYAVTYGPIHIRVKAEETYLQNNSNGWTLLFKNMGFYGADYMKRAIVAMTGIGANLPQDSVYAPAFTDVHQIPLVGNNNYMIHFNQGQLPPVNAFWSLSLYNDKGFLVENPINRYAISPHLSKLNYNINGSLDILIGKELPGIDYLTNWLPASNGPFNLVLRMYWPQQLILSGEWLPPLIKKIKSGA